MRSVSARGPASAPSSSPNAPHPALAAGEARDGPRPEAGGRRDPPRRPAWRALWFSALTDRLTPIDADGTVQRIEPPTLDQWIDAFRELLGPHTGSTRAIRGYDQTLSAGRSWDEPGDDEALDQLVASVAPVESVLRSHRWLRVREAGRRERGSRHIDELAA